MNAFVVFWLIIFFIFLIIELGHPGLFFFLSFALGAGVTAIVSIYSISLFIQSITFVVATIIAFAVLKYWVRLHGTRGHQHETNMYALQGKRGIVIKAINSPSPGQVNINGQIWSAKSVHDAPIVLGAQVMVMHVIGCHVIVQEIKKS